MIHYFVRWHFKLSTPTSSQLQRVGKTFFVCHLSFSSRKFLQFEGDICSRHFVVEINEQHSRRTWNTGKSFNLGNLDGVFPRWLSFLGPFQVTQVCPSVRKKNQIAAIPLSVIQSSLKRFNAHFALTALRCQAISLKSPTHLTPSRRHKYSSRYDMIHRTPMNEETIKLK